MIIKPATATMQLQGANLFFKICNNLSNELDETEIKSALLVK